MFAGWVMCVAMRLFEKGKITHKLRWGGDWSMDWYTEDQSFFDGVHFELVPL
jgi:peptidoglycan L-alanyl-D-glutamate endopeptidase CwlK